jgi:hypothetical protein
MNKRIKYLESLIPEGLDINEKYFDKFSKYATYSGNGVYQWYGILSTDTRELFLMGCLHCEKIPFEQT